MARDYVVQHPGVLQKVRHYPVWRRRAELWRPKAARNHGALLTIWVGPLGCWVDPDHTAARRPLVFFRMSPEQWSESRFMHGLQTVQEVLDAGGDP